MPNNVDMGFWYHYYFFIMEEAKSNNPEIIGLTGSFGSGCGYIAENIFEEEGYELLSLSEALKELFKKEKGKDPKECPRRELQDFGDEIRKKSGADFFAKEIINQIDQSIENESVENEKREKKKWVVKSIRNPAEIRALRERSRNFFLFGVYANKMVRWERVKDDEYKVDLRQFELDDENDSGKNNERYGQRVGDCFYEADVVITNNKEFAVPYNVEFKELKEKVTQYIDIAAHPQSKRPPYKGEEPLMAMAFAISQRSSCLKRKVGAIIVDGKGNVISSGYNEVPPHERPCRDEYTRCYREHLYLDFSKKLEEEFEVLRGKGDNLTNFFRSNFKILDKCRALHAEEKVILNLARIGRSIPLDQCILYTTTYPCARCASRIVDVGIKHIIYLEPYPDDEAKKILREINDQFFEGVTFKGYFRLYGEKK